MESLKIKKIGYVGYTTFITEDEKGKRSFVMVRKNLLGGYTTIDDTGIKQKQDDFSVRSLKICSSSWQLLANCTLVKSVNESLTLQYNQSQQLQMQLMNTSKERDSVASQLAGAQEQLEASSGRIDSLERNLQAVQELTSMQRQSLKFGLDLACFVNCHREWEETVYDKPNEYQRTIFGMTCVPKTVYKEDDYQAKLDWELYFEYLLKQDSISAKCKESIGRLKLSILELQSRVGSLSDKSLSTDYTKVSAMKVSFVMQLRDFFYLYRNEMGTANVYYHYSFNHRLPGDENDSYVYSSDDLIADGEKSCAKLIESLFGLEEAQKFLQQTQELTQHKTSAQVIA